MNIVSLIGRPGCGKGTQIDRIIEKTDWKPLQTGELLRKRAKKDDFLGNEIEEIMMEGELIPTSLVLHFWMPELIDIKKKSSEEGIIFDGNPRKLIEARLLEEIFEMFDWLEDFQPVHIDISPEEAKRRLLDRGRADDSKEEIEKRLEWFETEVVPVLDYYRDKGNLIRIDGEQTRDEVQQDIFQALNLDD